MGCFKLLFNSRKAQVGLFFTWLIIVIIFSVMAAIIAPMGVVFNTEILAASENIYLQANDSLQQIQDPTIKAAVQSNIDKSFDAGQYNIQVTNNLYVYMWLIILIITAIILYVFSRQTVEYASGGFV